MTNVQYKCCTRCKQELPATPEYFHRFHRGRLGLTPWCKSCTAEAHGVKKRYKIIPCEPGMRGCRNCGNILPATPEYFDVNSKCKDGISHRCRKCGQTRRSELKKQPHIRTKRNEDNRRYTKTEIGRKKNSERVNRYRKANPDKIRAIKKRGYEKNKNRDRKTKRSYYLKNRDVFLERARNRVVDPIKRAVAAQRRLARLRSLPDTFTEAEWRRCLEYFDHRCAVCGREFSDTLKVHADHWIPLIHPDCPGTVASNMIPLCGGKGGCNQSKNKADAHTWLLDFYPPHEADAILARIHTYFETVKRV